MIIFYDPTTNNQIKALYSHNTASTVWKGRGYVRLEVANPAYTPQLVSEAQDLRAVVVDGLLVGLEPWPRPILRASLNPMPADGVAVSVVTATFVDPGYSENVEFRVDNGEPMVVTVVNGEATLEFGPVEVADKYEVRCSSPTYGERRITVEVSDA